MRIDRLHIDGLRSLQQVELALAPGLNLFVGPNGAGKSSLLEAVYLLSHGRSFRSGAREALVQRGRDGLSIFAAIVDTQGAQHRLGLGRAGGRWSVRVDGADGASLGDLVRHCAVVCFEPGSHALIAGAAEERRRFLDWGVFHVEHAFLSAWRRYQRALRQRNAALRSGPAPDAVLEPFERELDMAAVSVDTARQAYLERWRPHVRRLVAALLPELGDVQIGYRRGWASDTSLFDALAERRERDRLRGHSTVGAHRADWSVQFEEAPHRDHLSRGQEKLCALACVLAQGAVYAETAGHWPIVALDDLASELDRAHQEAVVEQLLAADAQLLVTGTEHPAALDGRPATMFHVEQGQATRLL